MNFGAEGSATPVYGGATVMPTVVTTSAAEESADTGDRRSRGDCSQAANAAARAAAMTAIK